MQSAAEHEFRGFVEAHGESLLHTAYLLTGDQQLAEDLVQTALERAATHWDSIRNRCAAPAYVRRTMYRAQLTSWRRRHVTELLCATIPEPRRSAENGDVVEDRLVLHDALMHLGPGQRAVVAMRYLEDLSEQQVAEALGVSVGTVKSQTHKAIASLRESVDGLSTPRRGP